MNVIDFLNIIGELKLKVKIIDGKRVIITPKRLVPREVLDFVRANQECLVDELIRIERWDFAKRGLDELDVARSSIIDDTTSDSVVHFVSAVRDVGVFEIDIPRGKYDRYMTFLYGGSFTTH